MNYVCNRCKKEFIGDPALRNGTGNYCTKCKKDIHKKARENNGKNTYRKYDPDHTCKWCGATITEHGRIIRNETVCTRCCTTRDWLLGCIRLSEAPYKYVVRTEERERPIREERKRQAARQEAEEQKAKDAIVIERGHADSPSEVEARVRRIELLLNKLTEQLNI